MNSKFLVIAFVLGLLSIFTQQVYSIELCPYTMKITLNDIDSFEITGETNFNGTNYKLECSSLMPYTNWDKLNQDLEVSSKDYILKIENFSNVKPNLDFDGEWYLDDKDLILFFEGLQPFNNTFVINNRTLKVNFVESNIPDIQIMQLPTKFTARQSERVRLLVRDDTDIKNVVILHDNITEVLIVEFPGIYLGSLMFLDFGDKNLTILATDIFGNNKTLDYNIQIEPRQTIRATEYGGSLSRNSKSIFPILKTDKETTFNITLASLQPNNIQYFIKISSENDNSGLELGKSIIIKGSSINLEFEPGKPLTLTTNSTIPDSFILNLSIIPDSSDVLDKNILSYGFRISNETQVSNYTISLGLFNFECFDNGFDYECKSRYPKTSFDLSGIMALMPTAVLEDVKESYESANKDERDKREAAEGNFWFIIFILSIVLLSISSYWILIKRGLITPKIASKS